LVFFRSHYLHAIDTISVFSAFMLLLTKYFYCSDMVSGIVLPATLSVRQHPPYGFSLPIFKHLHEFHAHYYTVAWLLQNINLDFYLLASQQ